jgi:hypothetical protein
MMIRFGFSIRTRTGQRVDNIQIVAATLDDAERRLRQMYVQCEIVDVRERAFTRKPDSLDVEGVIEMISASPSSGHKPGTQ